MAQQALCNALGVSDLHWVWAIDATSGPRLRFVWTHRAISSQHASVLDPMAQMKRSRRALLKLGPLPLRPGAQL